MKELLVRRHPSLPSTTCVEGRWPGDSRVGGEGGRGMDSGPGGANSQGVRIRRTALRIAGNTAGPLSHATVLWHGGMTSACGRTGRGSDGPLDRHSLPRLRFAYPYAYAQGSLWVLPHHRNHLSFIVVGAARENCEPKAWMWEAGSSVWGRAIVGPGRRFLTPPYRSIHIDFGVTAYYDCYSICAFRSSAISRIISRSALTIRRS